MKFLSALAAATVLTLAGFGVRSSGFGVLGSGSGSGSAVLTAAGDPLTIATLSSRADMVSGSAAFHVNAERRSLTGLVDGLKNGRNTIVAKRGSQTARLDVTNYPITGPI